MKTLIKKAAAIILVVSVVLSVNNCKKEKTVIVKEDDVPTADFILGKPDYEGGETLVLTSSSSNAASVRWTLPDGTTSKSNSVSWATDIMEHEQTFQFKLEAISEHGTKSDYIVKNVKVKPTTGNVTFYTYNYMVQTGLPASFTGTLSIDGKVYGEITIPSVEDTNNVPTSCNQSGYPTLSLPIGYHSFNFVYSVGGNISASSTGVNISAGGCKVVGIQAYYWK